MLSATRRRVFPASLLVAGALSVGVLGSTIPAQASISAPTVTVPAAAVAPASALTLSRTASIMLASSAVVHAAAVHTAVVTPAAARAAAAARFARLVTRIRTTAVHVALSRLGSRYVAGRSGPYNFDCSGLALYVVKHSTGRSLPHYSRAQYAVTQRVSRSHLRPGDLVFFFRYGTHHVGIYIGGGRMISATNPSGGVKIDSVFSGWYGSRYSGAGRLV